MRKSERIILRNKNGVEIKKISISTLSRLDTVLKPMVEMAVNDDIILKNPFRGVIGEIRGESHFSNRKIPALTIMQQNVFMDYVFNMDKHIYIRNMIIFLLGTDCRIGETVGLRWSDIDFDRNTVSINHAVGYIRQKVRFERNFLLRCNTRFIMIIYRVR